MNEQSENLNGLGAGAAFNRACRKWCKVVMAQIYNAREAILAEARETLQIQERLLRLAVKEAEGLAWQTTYPQLVFPNLAMEKIQGVVRLNRRQQRIP